MNMSLRWYGPGYDTVTLEQIRQIPGVRGVITTLYGTQPGEVWDREEIRSLKKTVEDAGLSILGIESVNVHDDIKTGAKDRDRCIDNYITTLERLGEEDIHMVCYNFMPGKIRSETRYPPPEIRGSPCPSRLFPAGPETPLKPRQPPKPGHGHSKP
jgi:mannonate dehydratase